MFYTYYINLVPLYKLLIYKVLYIILIKHRTLVLQLVCGYDTI